MKIPIDTFVAPKCELEIDVLHQDEHFLLINKPSGLLSLSGKNPLNWDSVHYRLVQDYPHAKLVHRLDFGTSGIMLVALSKPANKAFTQQFQAHRIDKTYISVLAGQIAQNRGKITAPIAKDPSLFPRLKVCFETGKTSSSEYEVLTRDFTSTRVRFTPQTGRTHQLRIHSQFIGHPILGCDLYGTDSTKLSASRLLLHAETLTFTHPITGEKIVVCCPCPF